MGRVPATEGLFGEGVSLSMERGRVIVDEHFKTSMDGVCNRRFDSGNAALHILLPHRGFAFAEELAGEREA